MSRNSDQDVLTTGSREWSKESADEAPITPDVGDLCGQPLRPCPRYYCGHDLGDARLGVTSQFRTNIKAKRVRKGDR